MAVENPHGNGLTENDDVRHRALLRLAVAGLVTAAALAGLWWLDHGSARNPVATEPIAQPAPIVTAPMRESAPPLPAPGETAPAEPAATTLAAEPDTGTEPAKAPAAAANTARPTEPPPPPRVSNAQKKPAGAASPARATPATPSTPAASPVNQPAVPAGERFVVQLGVFSNPDRARELVDKLKKQGVRAHMETRVELGPFAYREEAEKAQAAMRKLGMAALISPAAATK